MGNGLDSHCKEPPHDRKIEFFLKIYSKAQFSLCQLTVRTVVFITYYILMI